MPSSLCRSGPPLPVILALSSLALICACGSDANSGSGQNAWINRTAGTAAAYLPFTDVASDSSGTHLVAVTKPISAFPPG